MDLPAVEALEEGYVLVVLGPTSRRRALRAAVWGTVCQLLRPLAVCAGLQGLFDSSNSSSDPLPTSVSGQRRATPGQHRSGGWAPQLSTGRSARLHLPTRRGLRLGLRTAAEALREASCRWASGIFEHRPGRDRRPAHQQAHDAALQPIDHSGHGHRQQLRLAVSGPSGQLLSEQHAAQQAAWQQGARAAFVLQG